ncbi:MAG: diaminopimelate epimerase [Alphaproteobacteria bacterium]
MSGAAFIKMHGLGNDFVVLDARARALRLDNDQVRAIADRKSGVGCDQLIVLEPARDADAFMRIYNADGGEVEACGNATRCVGALLFAETGRQHADILTGAGRLLADAAPGGRVAVDMGVPRLEWRQIPLAREMDTLHLDLSLGPLSDPVAMNIGNPHATFFVPDAEAVDIADLGPQLEVHPLFPERVNVGIASLSAPDTLRFRVWERGVGITRACGTGACAAAVAAARRGLTGRTVDVDLDGGRLRLEWRDDNHVVMTGPVATSFTGMLDASLLASASLS